MIVNCDPTLCRARPAQVPGTRQVPDGAALLTVGDVDQQPSMGPGQVLADIIVSGAVPVVLLTEVVYQVAQSRIVTTAHQSDWSVCRFRNEKHQRWQGRGSSPRRSSTVRRQIKWANRVGLVAEALALSD